MRIAWTFVAVACSGYFQEFIADPSMFGAETNLTHRQDSSGLEDARFQ